MAFLFRLETREGLPAEPAQLSSAVPNWRPGDTIPLGKRTLQVVELRDDEADAPPVLIVEELATRNSSSEGPEHQPPDQEGNADEPTAGEDYGDDPSAGRVDIGVYQGKHQWAHQANEYHEKHEDPARDGVDLCDARDKRRSQAKSLQPT
jgi:hypothetical protein